MLATLCRATELPHPQRSTTGTKTRPAATAIGDSTPLSNPGQTVTRRRGSGPLSFLWRLTSVVHTLRRVFRSQAITSPALPAPTTRSRPPCAATTGVASKS